MLNNSEPRGPHDAPNCPKCGAIDVRCGHLWKCLNCGFETDFSGKVDAREFLRPERGVIPTPRKASIFGKIGATAVLSTIIFILSRFFGLAYAARGEWFLLVVAAIVAVGGSLLILWIWFGKD